MSDFLSQLSARITKNRNSGAIQPRLPARFESINPVAPLAAAEDVVPSSPSMLEESHGLPSPGPMPTQGEVVGLDLKIQSTRGDRGQSEKRAIGKDDHVSVDESGAIRHTQTPLPTQRTETRIQRARRQGRQRNLLAEDQKTDVVDNETERSATIQLVTDSWVQPVHDGTPHNPMLLTREAFDEATHYQLAEQVASTIVPAQSGRETASENLSGYLDMSEPRDLPTQETDFRLAEQIPAALLRAQSNHDTLAEDEAGASHLTAPQSPGDPLRSRLMLETSSPSESAPPVPTINVRIGRIEVRASSPPANYPRPVREKARPGADLEAYLRQRSEGRKE